MLLKRRFLHALIAVGLVAGFVTSPRADAGTYSVPFCNRSLSGTSTSGWDISATEGGATPYFWGGGTCQNGRVYRRFEIWGLPVGASNDMTFDAPDGTYISQFEIAHQAYPRVGGAMAAIYSWQQDGTRTLTAAANEGESLGSGTYFFPLSGSKVIKLRESILCVQTPNSASRCDGRDSQSRYGNEDTWFGAVVQLVDPEAPVIGSVAGVGWNPEPVDGSDTFDWSVSDVGLGVKEVAFYLDGTMLGSHPGACVAETVKPCPTSDSGTFTLDTTKFSEGQHELELRAVDASMNEVSKKLTVTIRRPPQAPDGSASITDTTTAGGAVPAVGDQLHGSSGSWSGSGLSFTYQWLRCAADGSGCAPISGATGVNYTPVTADVGHALQFCVTATNSSGSATSCSMPTPAVVASRPGGSSATPVSADPVERPTQPGKSGSGSTATVDRGQPNGSPASDRVVLTALANSRASTLKVKYGKRVPITGRLAGPSGEPIVGATLEIQTRTALPNAAVVNAGRVVTGADGRFKYTAPAGPSRTVRFAYRSHSADTSFVDVTDVNLLVAAGVTIKATPKRVRNRHATVFTGRLLGKPIAKRGVVVDLQVFFRHKWRTFGAPRTNRAGKYKFKYRFMAGAATWKFRARVRRESSYPYYEGYSAKTVKVKVTR